MTDRILFLEMLMGRTLESNASVVPRIAECWGFQRERIALLETGYRDGWCDHAAFRVAGLGYSTDFRNLAMDPAFDERAE